MTELCPTHGPVSSVPACPICGLPLLLLPTTQRSDSDVSNDRVSTPFDGTPKPKDRP